MIYFIRTRQLNYVKIGFSEDPSLRLCTLSTACPVELYIDHVVDGDQRLERTLHRRFRHLHVRGEWFTFGAEIQSFIDDLKANPDYFDGSYSVAGLAKYLNCSIGLVTRHIEAGSIRPLNFGSGTHQFVRIPEVEVRRFLQSRPTSRDPKPKKRRKLAKAYREFF